MKCVISRGVSIILFFYIRAIFAPAQCPCSYGVSQSHPAHWGVRPTRPRQSWWAACHVPDRHPNDGPFRRRTRAHTHPMEASAFQGQFRTRRIPLYSVPLALGGSQACVTARCNRVYVGLIPACVHPAALAHCAACLLFSKAEENLLVLVSPTEKIGSQERRSRIKKTDIDIDGESSFDSVYVQMPRKCRNFRSISC